MLKSARNFGKCMLRSPLAAPGTNQSTKPKSTAASTARPTVMIDVTYEERSRKYMTANHRIFTMSLPQRRSKMSPMPGLPSELQKSMRCCAVLKDVTIRQRMLPELPERRKEIFDFCNSLKYIQVCKPIGQTTTKNLRYNGKTDLENLHTK